jgi:two-component system, OmpR family, sensor histidine kinase TctE
MPRTEAAAGKSRGWLSAMVGWNNHRTLRRQLIAWLAAPLLILWAVSTVVDYDIAKRFVNLAYDRTLLETAQDIARQLRVINDRVYVDLPEVAQQILQTGGSGRLYYLVTGPGREFITGEPDLPPPPDTTTDESPDRVFYYDHLFRGFAIRAVALRVPIEPGSNRGVALIQVAERVTARDEFARQIILRMVLPQGLLILFVGLAVWYGVGRGLAPLSALRQELQNRSYRDLSALPEVQAPQEVRPLIRAMNELLARVAATISAQQRFIADAAHQLRTPVAGIKTQTELALRQSPSGDAQVTLKQLHTATEQTIRLVNQLLSLARTEPGAAPSRHAPLDLVSLARDTATEWVPRALERNIDLGFESPLPAWPITGDAFMLKEMLNNLLDNAVRYTRPGGQVTVRVREAPRGVVLSVEDNGPGVPSAERERVFERFHRVLGSGADGAGLGLAIVREIALAHGAETSLDAGADGAGTLARVVFPGKTGDREIGKS